MEYVLGLLILFSFTNHFTNTIDQLSQGYDGGRGGYGGVSVKFAHIFTQLHIMSLMPFTNIQFKGLWRKRRIWRRCKYFFSLLILSLIYKSCF